MSWIVYSWTFLFLIGAVVSAWNLRECWRDLRAARSRDWLGTSVPDAARYELGSEAIRFAELVAGFVAGVLSWAMLLHFAVLYLLFIIPIGLVVNTLRAVRFRVSYGHAHKVRRTGGVK